MSTPDRDPASEAIEPNGGPDASEEADTEAHSLGTEQLARLQVRERNREADAWARGEAARRGSKSLIDRIRRR